MLTMEPLVSLAGQPASISSGAHTPEWVVSAESYIAQNCYASISAARLTQLTDLSISRASSPDSTPS